MPVDTKLTSESLRAGLQAFWNEQLEIEPMRDGFAVAYPLMYPDGWQIVLEIRQVAPALAVIRDGGRTLKQFIDVGFNFDARAKATHELLNERLAVHGLKQDGFNLWKETAFPIEALDVHLFAESIASIAYLIYRHEPAAEMESAADKAVGQIFASRNLHPLRNHVLAGKVESKIRMDYYMEGHKPLGLQVIRRRGGILDYMEQWAWRWTDLHAAQPKLIRAMVYDPSLQDITPTVQKIGESVCEVFCPYYESDELTKTIG
jgi:hypothetical protein